MTHPLHLGGLAILAAWFGAMALGWLPLVHLDWGAKTTVPADAGFWRFGPSSPLVLALSWGFLFALRATLLRSREQPRAVAPRRLMSGALFWIGVGLALGVVGLAGFLGYWSLNAEPLAALGAGLAAGQNPYLLANADQTAGDGAPLGMLASALVFHWANLGDNAANAVWSASVVVALVTGWGLAILSTWAERLSLARTWLVITSPIVLLWGLGTMSPALLAAPLLVLGFAAVARGWAVCGAVSLGLAVGFAPLAALAAPAALLPGAVLRRDKPLGLASSVRGAIIFLVVVGLLYLPLGLAVIQDGASVSPPRSSAMAPPGLVHSLAVAVGEPPLVRATGAGGWLAVALVAGVAIVVETVAIVRQHLAKRAAAKAVTVAPIRRDHRARGFGFALILASLVLPQLGVGYLMLCLITWLRTPHLGIAAGTLGLAMVVAIEPATLAGAGAWAVVALAALPTAGLLVGAMVERRVAAVPAGSSAATSLTSQARP